MCCGFNFFQDRCKVDEVGTKDDEVSDRWPGEEVKSPLVALINGLGYQSEGLVK